MQTSSSSGSAGSSGQHNRSQNRIRNNLNVNLNFNNNSNNSNSGSGSSRANIKWHVALTPVTPGTPDSADILVGAAGQAANQRRNKTIMECFRDRTPSYTRSQQLKLQQHQQHLHGSRTRPEATFHLRETRSINKLAMLKSASTRDLTRLMQDESKLNNVTTNTPINNNNQNNYNSNKLNTSNINKLRYAHTGSSRSSSSSASSIGAQRARVFIRERSHCDKIRCVQRSEELEGRVAHLEQQLLEERSFTQELSTRVQELNRRVEQLNYVKDAAEKRKKSSSMRKKNFNGGGAGAATTTVQPTKLVAWMNLSNWFRHRPSIATLKEQNIYNDEPCFDTEIDVVLKHEVHKTIPKIVVDCCDLIEERYRRDTQPIEGIYRQCGDYNKIQGLRFAIDANDYESLRQPNIDIHTLTGVLKLFLREIKSPLVSTNEAKTFIGKPNQWLLTDLAAKIEILKRLIRSLPEINRDTMEYLFKHFHKLTKVPLQQNSAETLALSVTPSIFHTVQKGAHTQDIHELLKESEILADCVKIMIEYHSRIFECTAERRQRRISVRRLRKTLSHPDLIFQNFF